MSEAKPTPYPPLPPLIQEGVQFNIANGLAPFAGFHPEVHVPGLASMPAKRFSTAELAAEYWAPVFIHFPDPTVWDRDYEGYAAIMDARSETLYRFATTPHHFEHHGSAPEVGGDA